jgi:hypothetical protein
MARDNLGKMGTVSAVACHALFFVAGVTDVDSLEIAPSRASNGEFVAGWAVAVERIAVPGPAVGEETPGGPGHTYTPPTICDNRFYLKRSTSPAISSKYRFAKYLAWEFARYLAYSSNMDELAVLSEEASPTSALF